MADFIPFGIPTELMEKVFTHLWSWKDFANLELVNKAFKEISWKGVTRLRMEITYDELLAPSAAFNGKKITTDEETLVEVFCRIWKKCPMLTDLHLDVQWILAACGDLVGFDLAAEVLRKILALSKNFPRKLTRLVLGDGFSDIVFAPKVVYLFAESLVSLTVNWHLEEEKLTGYHFKSNFHIETTPLFEAVGESCKNLKRFSLCYTHFEDQPIFDPNLVKAFGKMLQNVTSLEKLDVSSVVCEFDRKRPQRGQSFTIPDEVARFLVKYQLDKAATAQEDDARLHLVIKFDAKAGWELRRFASSLRSNLEAHELHGGVTVLKDLTIHGVLGRDANYDLKPLYELLPSLKRVDVHVESELVDPSEMASEFLNFFSDAGCQKSMVIYMFRGGNNEAMVRKFDAVLPKVEEKAGVLGHMYLEPYETCCGATRGLYNRLRIHIHKGYADVWVRME